uniref:Uncharacterized protein n=1 Tax=Oryza brachyantha TaxID=4533 RepID=J3L102_ORYBR
MTHQKSPSSLEAKGYIFVVPSISSLLHDTISEEQNAHFKGITYIFFSKIACIHLEQWFEDLFLAVENSLVSDILISRPC